ncbi:hypothetical protein Tco_0691380 [Tanacetum coccineum]
MKTKNNSIKRKILFEDHIEERSSVVSMKSNVGHPTTFGCAPPLSYGQGYSSDIDPSLIGSSHAAKHEYCQTHVASQLSLAGTSSLKNDTDTHPLPPTTPPKIDKSHFHMPQAWRCQLQLEFAAYSETISTGVNLTLTAYSQHPIHRYRHLMCYRVGSIY